MIAFAANSILCRAALKPSDSVDTVIDPASYTVIRIVAGACVLFLIQVWRRKPTFRNPLQNKRWLSPLMLSGYAVGFSFAYIGLDTASGTLILFAFVQLTMIVIGILRKEFPRSLEIAGLILASTGLVYLVFPHLQTPRPGQMWSSKKKTTAFVDTMEKSGAQVDVDHRNNVASVSIVL